MNMSMYIQPTPPKTEKLTLHNMRTFTNGRDTYTSSVLTYTYYSYDFRYIHVKRADIDICRTYTQVKACYEVCYRRPPFIDGRHAPSLKPIYSRSVDFKTSVCGS